MHNSQNTTVTNETHELREMCRRIDLSTVKYKSFILIHLQLDYLVSPLISDLLNPKTDSFVSCPANHMCQDCLETRQCLQTPITRFQNIVFTISITDERTDERTDRLTTLCVRLPVLPGAGTKMDNCYKTNYKYKSF